ncbi:MAG: nucleoside-diphosphate kinase [Firmicutes bacterium]|nr:nucleoside-diphosphate kinase [Bacillota bacterium]
MENERTLLLIKPDSVHRGLIGRIVARYEDKGFNIAAMKLMHMTQAQAEDLYSPHVGKSFYDRTIKFMTSSPIVAIVIEGMDAINQVRSFNGATTPSEAHPGTIRGDFGQRVERNCVHGSDSKESAEREIPIFFKNEEILTYNKCLSEWV